MIKTIIYDGERPMEEDGINLVNREDVLTLDGYAKKFFTLNMNSPRSVMYKRKSRNEQVTPSMLYAEYLAYLNKKLHLWGDK